MNEPDIRKKVEETETGYELRISSTRGTGTRDQDTVKLTAHNETLAGLCSDLPQAERAVTEAMDRRREHQPDSGDTEESE